VRALLEFVSLFLLGIVSGVSFLIYSNAAPRQHFRARSSWPSSKYCYATMDLLSERWRLPRSCPRSRWAFLSSKRLWREPPFVFY